MNYSIGDGPFCVAGGRSGYQFVKKRSTMDGRLIQRHPIGRIEDIAPGIASRMAGVTYYAQIAYYDTDNRAWNTTNAIQLDFTN